MFWAKNKPLPEWTIDFGDRSPVILATCSRLREAAAGSGVVVVVVLVAVVLVEAGEVVELVEVVVVGDPAGAVVVVVTLAIVLGRDSSARVAVQAPSSNTPAMRRTCVRVVFMRCRAA
jgi:hypothetical protein